MTGAKHGSFWTRTDDAGKTHRVPVGIIDGARPGPQVTIYAGVHGTEYDGLEAAQRLYRETSPAEVSGRIVIGLAVNEESIFGWTQFAPLAPPVRDVMMEMARGSDLIIDCHGGEFSEGMCPYTICRLLGREDVDQETLRIGEAFLLPYLSISQYRGEPPDTGVRPAWWLYPRKSMADELGIPQITPEVGERGTRDDQGLMHRGIVNVLRAKGVLAGTPETPHQKARVIGDRFWITAEADGMFFPEVRVCQDVRKGQRLGLLRDYFGEVLQVVEAPADAKVINMNWGMPARKGGFLLWLGVIE